MDIWFFAFVISMLVFFVSVLVYAFFADSYIYKTVTVRNDKNIEPRLRAIMKENPNCEIAIIDRSSDEEVHTVLHKMEYDFPALHVIMYNGIQDEMRY